MQVGEIRFRQLHRLVNSAERRVVDTLLLNAARRSCLPMMTRHRSSCSHRGSAYSFLPAHNQCRATLPIDFTPMSHAIYMNGLGGVIDLVNNAVVADSD